METEENGNVVENDITEKPATVEETAPVEEAATEEKREIKPHGGKCYLFFKRLIANRKVGLGMILRCVSILFGLVAIFMLFAPNIWGKVDGDTYSGLETVFGTAHKTNFGDEKIFAFSFFNFLPYVLVLVSIVFAVIAVFGKLGNVAPIVSAACFVVAAVLFFVAVPCSVLDGIENATADEIIQMKEVMGLTLGAGTIVAGVFSIVSAILIAITIENTVKSHGGKCYLFFKRLFDIVSATLLLILTSWIILICLLVKWLEDFSNPIYVSTRVGKDGKVFKFFKIRTMCPHADELKTQLIEAGLNEADPPAFKMKDDPRITKVGKFLRKFSLDELPQLLNVIGGSMSVVGPRPPVPSEVEKYTDEQRQRLSVKGGLLCLWQIQKNRNELPFEEWIKLDLEYIEKRSIGLDLKIIFKGFYMVIFDHSGE